MREKDGYFKVEEHTKTCPYLLTRQNNDGSTSSRPASREEYLLFEEVKRLRREHV